MRDTENNRIEEKYKSAGDPKETIQLQRILRVSEILSNNYKQRLSKYCARDGHLIVLNIKILIQNHMIQPCRTFFNDVSLFKLSSSCFSLPSASRVSGFLSTSTCTCVEVIMTSRRKEQQLNYTLCDRIEGNMYSTNCSDGYACLSVLFLL